LVVAGASNPTTDFCLRSCICARAGSLQVKKETDEEKERLVAEGQQVKDMFRQVISEGEAEKAKVVTERDAALKRLKLETARFETDLAKLQVRQTPNPACTLLPPTSFHPPTHVRCALRHVVVHT
jgi:hypothetical protein